MTIDSESGRTDRSDVPVDEILPEYSLKGGVRGKYARRFAGVSNPAPPDADASDVSPDRIPESRRGPRE
jgi:hypothetical protein